jgi:hypothetical protein
VASSLVDSPPALDNGQAPPNGSATEPGTDARPPGASQPPPVERACAKCGAPMLAGQDWCLQCGAGRPDSLGTPGWRSAAAIFGAVAILVLGAAAAAYAALSKSTPKPLTVTTTVAQVAPPATATTPPTTATTPVTPGGAASTPTAKATLPLGAVKPPKIPLTAITPKASEKTTATTPTTEAKTTTPTTTTPATTTTGTGTGAGGEESQQSAIVLDTNAASTYNPYNFPASWFGDPSLTIDGDHATAWTAQVNPETSPTLAEGLLIDLKAKQKVAVLQLITSTPGMTVQVYGANGHTVPESITDPAWVPLSSPRVIKKKSVRFKLRDSKKAFTYVTLWISKAPESAVGTATAPGHVDVNEVELFPPKS